MDGFSKHNLKICIKNDKIFDTKCEASINLEKCVPLAHLEKAVDEGVS